MARQYKWEYWNPIDTAPRDTELMLTVEDGEGRQYKLLRPCRLTTAGWVSSAKGTALVVKPVKWRLSGLKQS